jgi:hypothetical protein
VPSGFNPTETATDATRSRSPTHLLALTAILAIGFAVRLAYLSIVTSAPGFVWGDPDGYLQHALMLARGPHGWHWTFDAVTYYINGQWHALPPLYSVFLSVLALFPGLPYSAQAAQVVLSTAAIGLVFALGRVVHSTAAGLWAAAAYACSVPAIFGIWSSSQETVYIPLLLFAFLLLSRAMTADARPLAFGVAGVVFGLAALTRSMPMFFMLPAALLLVVTSPARRRAIWQALAFVAGFTLIVAPYCIALSNALGQLTLIDSHGSIHVSADAATNRAPGIAATVEGLLRDFSRAPVQYVEDSVARARSLLHVNGGRQLQIYVVAGSRATAVLWKVIVHLGTDLLLVAASVLAAFGAVLCRNSRVAAVFLLWAAINIAIASIGGFGGARLRSPFEPLLLILGSVVLAGNWKKRSAPTLAAAAAVSVGLGILVLPQFPQSLRGRPDFGVRWDSVMTRDRGAMRGEAGFNVIAYDGTAQVIVQADSAAPTRIELRSGSTTLGPFALEAGERTLTWPWPERGLAFAELRATTLQTGAPSTVRVIVKAH